MVCAYTLVFLVVKFFCTFYHRLIRYNRRAKAKQTKKATAELAACMRSYTNAVFRSCLHSFKLAAKTLVYIQNTGKQRVILHCQGPKDARPD